MFDFLKDDDNLVLRNKVSNLIENQLPGFIQTEGSQFIEFLEKYYEWMESHELTISNVTQNEFRLTLQTEGDIFLLEDGFGLTLENNRTNVSAYEQNEIVTGQSSGATGIVDRNTNTSSSKIYVSGITKKDFTPGEVIIGTNNRTESTVVSYLKNPLFASKSLLKSRDVDSATTTILDHFTEEFLSNIPDNLYVDKSLIIKHIVDVYRAKGSAISYDFLFKSLYDIQDLVFYSPKEDILKPSSGNWLKESSLRILTDDDIDKFESRIVTGQSSGATAIVDRVEKFAAGTLLITELFLTGLEGTFVVGETVTTTEIDGASGTGIAQGILTNINIVGAGTDYKVGDVITISGGGGVEAAARISQVGSGALTAFTVFDGGDGFVKGLDVTVNNFGTGGTGFAGKLDKIAETFTFSVNEDVVGDFIVVTLDAAEFGLSGNTQANVSDRIIDALGFSKFDAGMIKTVTPTTGTGYQALPQITVTEPRSSVFIDASVRILNLNSDPDGLASTNAITGTFRTGERITSNNGNKVGTIFGLVFDDDTISNPSRARVKTIAYLGQTISPEGDSVAIGSGRNDFAVNNTNYVNSTLPTVYDVQIVQTGFSITNTFKFRRGIDASNPIDAGENATIEFIDASDAVAITGDYQKLQFPVSTMTQTSGTATVTTTYNHGLFDGQKVIISGANESEYNGEQTITVASDTTFTFSVDSGASSPATGTVVYDENVSVKFTLPFGHTSTDRYLFSAIDFDSNELITGFSTESTMVVNTGVAFSVGGDLGNNATVGVSAEGAGTGSIKAIEITNPGVGFTSSPTLTALGGGGDASLTANIGAVATSVGKYLDQNGFLSSGKKLIDSNYYQDYSYSLRVNKQLNEYSQIVKKLLHPAGNKLFGEFSPPAEELQMGFDNLLIYEDGGEVLLEDSGDNILIEQYFEPTHSITLTNNRDIIDFGQGGTVQITGNSTQVIGTGTKFATDFDTDSTIVIDDEQAFIISYGELRLENTLDGTILSDSSNVICRITVDSNATSNFTANTIVTQIVDGFTVSGIVLSHSLDSQNNNILLLHTCSGIYDTSSNANSGSISMSFTTVKGNAIFGTGTNFEVDFRINDEIKALSTREKAKVLEIVNSSCIIANTTISTDLSYDFVYNDNGDDYEVGLSKILLEDDSGDVLTLNYRTANSTSYDNETIQYYELLEQTVRGTVSANGLNDGSNTITSSNGTFFEQDLQVNEIIALSSNTSLRAKIVSITSKNNLRLSPDYDQFLILEDGDQFLLEDSPLVETLTLNTAIGNGSSNQTITLYSSRYLDLEKNDTTLYLNIPYQSTNNFMYIQQANGNFGTLLLEDGVGTSNAGYVGTSSTEGGFKFETETTFFNQVPRKVTT